MIQRCTNPNATNWHNYGGRGIQVCDEWMKSFETFYAHIGPKTTPRHSVDRFPNQNGNYEPGNVRWATPREQANNMRANRLVTVEGVTHTIADWSRINGVPVTAIYGRLNNGWPEAEAISTLPDYTAGRFTSTKPITFQGETRSMAEWSKAKGFPRHMVSNRIAAGWTIEKALSTPVEEKYSHHKRGLTADEKEQIKVMYANGTKQADLALQFEVSQPTISEIVNHSKSPVQAGRAAQEEDGW